jgi:hypothetical protein
MSTFIKSEGYLQMKSLIQAMAEASELVSLDVIQVQETLKSFTADITGKVLGSGVNALSIEQEEKTKLYETVTSDEITIPLTEFFVYLLLGNDNSSVAPFDLENKNMALAVTFLSNVRRYMSAHSSEVILSWLRTEDSYYDNEDWHIHETVFHYDAEGHFEKCECGYEGEKIAHVFGEWSTLPVTNGEKKEMRRRCHCGYEEFKEAENVVDNNDSKAIAPRTIVLICIGGAMIVAVSVTAVVIVKKKKTINERRG